MPSFNVPTPLTSPTQYGTLNVNNLRSNNTGTTDLTSAQRPNALTPNGSPPQRAQNIRVNSSIGSPVQNGLYKVPNSPIAPLNPLSPSNQAQAAKTSTLAARVQSLKIFPLNTDGSICGSVLDRKGYATVELASESGRDSVRNLRWGLDAGRMERDIEDVDEEEEGVFSHRLLGEDGEEVLKSLFDVVGLQLGGSRGSSGRESSRTSKDSRMSSTNFLNFGGEKASRTVTQRWQVMEGGKMIGTGVTERKENSKGETKLQTTLFDSHGDPRILVTVNERPGSLLPFFAVPDSWKNRLQLVDLRTRARVAVGGWGLTRSLSSLGMWRLGAMEVEVDKKCQDVELRKLALAYLVGAGRSHAAGVDEEGLGSGKKRKWIWMVAVIMLIVALIRFRKAPQAEINPPEGSAFLEVLK